MMIQIMGGGENKEVTVTLDLNGGSGLDGNKVTGIKGEPMTLGIPERSGYIFYGWCRGHTKVNTDVFPDDNITLIARYRALEDKIITRVDTMEINKQYESDVQIGFYADNDEWKNTLDYFSNNNQIDVNLEIKYSAYFSAPAIAVSLGNKGTVTICGANTGDVIDSNTITNNEGYKSYSFTKDLKASIFVPPDDDDEKYYMHIINETNNWNCSCYLKNVEIVITYTESKGTLV